MPAGRRSSAARTARAFAPGHVTGFFEPDLTARDPRARGSTGGGVVLEVGAVATARWRPSGRRGVRVRSPEGEDLPISVEVAGRLAAGAAGSIEVVVEHALPVGQGFGMSAAGALSTGLAVADLLGVPRSRAVATAHLAELFGGGGLGGVAAILGGGVEFRRTPGIPPWGEIRHQTERGRLIIGVAGRPLPSPRLLQSPRFLTRVHAAARSAGHPRGSRPGLLGLLQTSEGFTDALRLDSAGLRGLLRELRGVGTPCAQAMFGNSFFAAPPGAVERARALRVLQRRRLPAIEVRPALGGARLLPPRSEPRGRG